MGNAAVAIKYDTNLPAPFVVARGRGELAERIVELARGFGIEVVSRPGLAEQLYLFDAGDFIDEDFFEVVAEILAFVFRLRDER
jgi:type III secretion system FlhB-like substrate exporter